MNRKSTFLLVITMLLGASVSFAQFTLSGEFRPRTEFSHGYKSLAGADQDLSMFTQQRSRINFVYNTDKVKTKLVLQDVRTWGNQPQLVANEKFSTSVHEAWAEVMFSKTFSLKAGRQELVYDDSRIFGNVGWAHQARSHDLALFKLENEFKLHVGVAYNENTVRNNNVYGGPDAYKAMQFLWFNNKFGKLDFSFLFLNNGKEQYSADSLSSAPVYSQTTGPRFFYKSDKIMAGATFYYQMGKDLAAMYYHVELGYKLADNFGLKLGYEALSGSESGVDAETDKLVRNAGENNSFTPLYGTNHKFNGFMDYFFVGNHVGLVGLNDIYAKGVYKMGSYSLTGMVHMFSTAADLKNKDGDVMDAGLGTEIDLVIGRKINDMASLSCGYSHMMGTETMEVLKGGSADEMSNWAWVMLTVKPTFFTNK
jgi:hypothetical protein